MIKLKIFVKFEKSFRGIQKGGKLCLRFGKVAVNGADPIFFRISLFGFC